MYWRYKLDGNVVSNPTDWREVEFTLQRLKGIDGILENFSAPAIFRDTGYDAIKTEFDTDYRGSLTVTIEERCSNSGPWTEIWDGTLFVSGAKFNLNRCLVDAAIEDASYTAMIANNKEIKAYVDTARSKNDDTSIAAAAFTLIDFFTPSTGVYDKTNRECYQVYDCFNMLVQFMSDNAMEFDSVAFGAGGDWEDLWLVSGQELRTVLAIVPDKTPFISFGDLFREIDKKINIAFYLDFTGAKPKMWIEPEDDIFLTTTGLTLSNVENIEKSVNLDRMYAKAKIGSNFHQPSESGTFSWPDVQFMNFRKEEYHLLGDANVGTTLDLVGDYIVDHNVIEDVLVNSVLDYDAEVFLVEADGGAGQAIQYDIFNLGVAPYSYNERLTNQAVTPRHLRNVPNDLALYLGDGNDGFEATRTATTSGAASFAFTLWDYDNEVSDPNANYDNTAGNYKYTAPSTGFYRFEVNCPLELDSVAAGTDWDLDLEMRRYDSLSTLIATRAVTLSFTNDGVNAKLFANSDPQTCFVTRGIVLLGAPTPFSIIWQPLGFYAAATDYIQVYIKATTNLGSVVWEFAGGTYKSTQVETGGGTYQVTDPDDARVINYRFSAPLSLTQYRALQTDPRQLIAFTGNPDGSTNKGWIEQLTYKPEEGRADFTLITAVNTDQ